MASGGRKKTLCIVTMATPAVSKATPTGTRSRRHIRILPPTVGHFKSQFG
jgi:hypothetical protein